MCDNVQQSIEKLLDERLKEVTTVINSTHDTVVQILELVNERKERHHAAKAAVYHHPEVMANSDIRHSVQRLMMQGNMDEEEFDISAEPFPLEASNSDLELDDAQIQPPEPAVQPIVKQQLAQPLIEPILTQQLAQPVIQPPLTQQLAQPDIQPTINAPVNMQWPFGQDEQSHSLMLPSQPPSQSSLRTPLRLRKPWPQPTPSLQTTPLQFSQAVPPTAGAYQAPETQQSAFSYSPSTGRVAQMVASSRGGLPIMLGKLMDTYFTREEQMHNRVNAVSRKYRGAWKSFGKLDKDKMKKVYAKLMQYFPAEMAALTPAELTEMINSRCRKLK